MQAKSRACALRTRCAFALTLFCLAMLSSYPSASRASRISAGLMFSCAVSQAGVAYCWGSNDVGQLGDGTTTTRDRPAAVQGLTRVKEIAAGVDHVCALTYAGAVKCWGANNAGELGDGTFIARTTPVSVVGLDSGVIAIGAGAEYSCALLDTGEVRCWGDNFWNELGTDIAIGLSSPIPVKVKLADGVTAKAIALPGGEMGGPPHSCLITGAGGVQCWGGENFYGEAGIPYGEVALIPRDVTDLTSGVVAVAVADSHSCALTQTSEILCWGDNMFGQLGDGTSSFGHFEPEPTLALAATPISIALSGSPSAIGGAYTCATTVSDFTYCWGFNGLGTQATGDRVDSWAPRLTQISRGSDLALADDHGCALTPNGFACWGNNLLGGIGNGTMGYRASPQPVQGLSDAATVVFAGGQQSCALLADGDVLCWGGNADGQLGDGTRTDRLFPVEVTGLPSDITSMSITGGHACAISNSGSAYCWGKNGAGNLGDGTGQDSAIAVGVVGLGTSVAIDVGGAHSCAVSSIGAVDCWGANGLGELGDGHASGDYSLVPVAATGLANGVVSVALGDAHSCALLATGEVRCWGYNGNGQLGDGTFDPRDEPVQVNPLALGQGTVAIAAGAQFTCALNADGSIKCWGWGYPALPTSIDGLGGAASSLAAGDTHACATFAGGRIQCWGQNGYGQLGDGTLVASQQPIDVSAMPAALDVDAGNSHTCAVAQTGEVYCWGLGASGQLGNGDYGFWLTPEQVLWDPMWDDLIFASGCDPETP